MKKLTNAQIIELLRSKVKTYTYFYKLSEADFNKRLDWFEAQIAELETLDPQEIQVSHYYNQNWSSALNKSLKDKKGA